MVFVIIYEMILLRNYVNHKIYTSKTMTKTSTFFALMAEYETASVELSRVCEKYFGLRPPEAAKRANTNRLPVPAYRCGTQKAKWLIHIDDLATHIDSQRAVAQQSWQKMNGNTHNQAT